MNQRGKCVGLGERERRGFEREIEDDLLTAGLGGRGRGRGSGSELSASLREFIIAKRRLPPYE